VLLPETPPDQAVLVAERLRAKIAQAPILIPGGMSVALMPSFGVSGKERLTEETINFLIPAADHVMYEAKAAGRNSVRAASNLPRSAL
jgi:diguanylate cyclase (GGDEF)-like protein